MNDLITDIIQSIKSVLPANIGPVALHEPTFKGREWEYVKECLDTGWVSSAGPFVTKFEQQLSEYTGVQFACATVNGTAALHICLLLSGVKPGDEVIIPDLTFVATANAVSYCGAIPHLVDVEKVSLGLNPSKLELYLKDLTIVRAGECFNRLTGRRIKSVVPMHTFGHPVDIDALTEIANKYHLVVVEDAAEALGSYYKGRHVGSGGLLAALSFNGNKTVTTGGGGAILTQNPELAKLAKHITTTAKVPHSWAFYHDMVGYNYRLPNINAALGCAQLEQLPAFIANKRYLADKYQQVFKAVKGVEFVKEPAYAKSNYWLNSILLDTEELRDQALAVTQEQGIYTRPAWILMHNLPMYKDSPRMSLEEAENLASRLLNLPSSAFLGEKDE
ncbi:MAG: LegC family aminotransferase [Methylocystaceae bacterium]